MKKAKSKFVQGVWVRKKDQPTFPPGVIADKGSFKGWWLVEWPDGSKKQFPERGLVIVPTPHAEG